MCSIWCGTKSPKVLVWFQFSFSSHISWSSRCCDLITLSVSQNSLKENPRIIINNNNWTTNFLKTHTMIYRFVLHLLEEWKQVSLRAHDRESLTRRSPSGGARLSVFWYSLNSFCIWRFFFFWRYSLVHLTARKHKQEPFKNDARNAENPSDMSMTSQQVDCHYLDIMTRIDVDEIYWAMNDRWRHHQM